jgi:DNA repair protein RadC
MDARVSKIGETDSVGHRSRLCERLLDNGPDGFHDYELIEYLLALTIPRVHTKPLAKRLLDNFRGYWAAAGRQR